MKLRLLLLLTFPLVLWMAVAGGLVRVGVPVPTSAGGIGWHGALMVGGFFGSLIALERAVALGKRWGWLAPVGAWLGALLLLAGRPEGMVLITAASLMLVAMSVSVWRRQAQNFTFYLAVAAGCWSIGNVLWLMARPLAEVLGWWMAFLVLTIAAERLELSRFAPRPPWAERAFDAAMLLWLAGLLSGAGLLTGLALLALAVWMVRFDVARHTVRGQGLPRFVAICLLSGYAWLALSALALMAGGGYQAGPGYDMALHGVVIGFVLSMVFGHALIILPAVSGLKARYRPQFYLPLLLLNIGLLIRFSGGWLARADWVALGASLNGVALLAFMLLVLNALREGRRRSRPGG